MAEQNKNTNTIFNVKDVKIKRGSIDNDYHWIIRDIFPTFLNVENDKMNKVR